MEVVVASHPSSLIHDTGPYHPERPERVSAARAGIESSGLVVVALEAPRLPKGGLELIHEPSYIEMIEDFCRRGGGALDMDTIVSQASWEAALTAAGGLRALVEQLGTRENATGFAITRPPGHHALPARAMGFCIFNNVALSAAWLRSDGKRVAILDWDVHHGNGTQSVFAQDPGVLYVSLHQANFYPFEGRVDDIDRAATKGTTVNIPLPAGTGGDVYRRAWDELVIPVVSAFEPDWVLISAGYDAHRDDRLADMNLIAEDYGYFAARLSRIHPAHRTAAALEGGYDLEGLKTSVDATLRGLAGEMPPDTESGSSPREAYSALELASESVARHWAL